MSGMGFLLGHRQEIAIKISHEHKHGCDALPVLLPGTNASCAKAVQPIASGRNRAHQSITVPISKYSLWKHQACYEESRHHLPVQRKTGLEDKACSAAWSSTRYDVCALRRRLFFYRFPLSQKAWHQAVH